ncbi:MAG TPA: FxSxx-COOH system tetratricopeptide repeat protein [Actinomycetes bacterium]|jgi:tetratricopeptide (TPR) repeat protein|nr:FxSxx-COOH system tetratricopeptide repeat protein [Actinomycetes bacterium]
MEAGRDFFVSFTGADRPWAQWLLAELDAAGYSSVSQLRDFVAGGNFTIDMDRAAQGARRTLGVLSARALQAPYVRQEWAQRLAADPIGEQHALVLVRVEPCEPQGLLRPVVYIDLVGLDEAAARARLREELAAVVRGTRLQPDVAAFPGSGPAGAVTGVQRPRFPTALPPVWNVPHRRNPTFTGREQALAQLAGELGRGAAAAVTQAIQGGGGIGKTALAVEYACRHCSEFDTVWWVRAEEPASLVSDYAALAEALGLPAAGEADQRVAAAGVRRWLDAHDRWLLILDNAQDPDTPTGLQAPLARVVDLLPPVLHGQVLVTSRDASWERYAALAELELFTQDEAVTFLVARSASSDRNSAAEVAELLGLLPLALEQAGAYVRETRLPLAAYLERLRQYPALTVAKGRPRDRDPADTVATTWQVSLERVRPVTGAAGLLEVCAFLGPEEIPRELFATLLDPPAAELVMLAEDPFALDEAVAALHRFGLVKASEQTLVVHRLLQQVVRDQLSPATTASRVSVAVRLLDERFPREGYQDPATWPICEQLLPHALAATGYAERLAAAGPTHTGQLAAIEPITRARLLTLAGGYVYGRARYPEAKALFIRALAIQEAVYGTKQPNAVALNSVGMILYTLGDFDGARSYCERAVATDESNYGPDHPEVAASLHNLANVLRAQGDLQGARTLQERALSICEASLGADHPHTANSLSSLANVLRAQGDLQGARTLHERALSIREASLGPDHPGTATSLNTLAAVLAAQGDLQGARTLHERALSIREASLGPDHPHTANCLSSLANVLAAQGDLQGARTLHERALSIREARLGADHPTTARSLSSLAGVLRAQGDLEGARTLHKRALAIYEASLGADHPDTQRSRDDLAAVVAALENRQ